MFFASHNTSRPIHHTDKQEASHKSSLVERGQLFYSANIPSVSRMRAAVYRSFSGPIVVEDNIPRPKVPHDGVLIAVQATGVCRSDWHGWKGHDSDIENHGIVPYFIPGHEVSGVVVQVGLHTRQFVQGDRVAIPFLLSCGTCRLCHQNRPTVCEQQKQPGFTMMGSFAEYLAIPRADRNLTKLPTNVSFVEAAALGCRFTTAYRAVAQQGGLIINYDNNNNNNNNNKVVAVFGCGGLGLSCIMIAKCFGAARIIAIDVTDGALQKALEVGATNLVNSRSVTNVQTHIVDLTDGLGADLCIDAAGFKATCEDAVCCTKRGGRMVQVGLPIGGHDPPIIPMGMVAGKEIEIYGSHGCAAGDMPKILKLVSNGQLEPKLLVERRVTLEEGAQAIMDMDHGSPIGITMVTNFTAPRANAPRSRY